MNLKVAGVGSRQTPEDCLQMLAKITHRLVMQGIRHVSGNADGADFACQSGAHAALLDLGIYHPTMFNEIILPFKEFNFNKLESMCTGNYLLAENSPAYQEAMYTARQIHPIGDSLKGFALKAHTRNVLQIYGYDMKDAVDFVVCFTAKGETKTSHCTSKTGGTATAIMLASEHDIPVFNIANKHALHEIAEFLKPYQQTQLNLAFSNQE